MILRFSLGVDLVVEELVVCDHPEAIEEEQERGHAKHFDSIVGQLVVHGRRELEEIGEVEPFEPPNIEVRKGSNREEKWHAGSI